MCSHTLLQRLRVFPESLASENTPQGHMEVFESRNAEMLLGVCFGGKLGQLWKIEFQDHFDALA